MTRPEWGDIWFGMAELLALRGTCLRLQTACVLVSPENRLIAVGYNGSPPGHPHCIDPGVGCELYEGHCVRSVHGERNALNNAAMVGAKTKGAVAYITHYPCIHCSLSLVAAGISAVYYRNPYHSYEGDVVYDMVRNLFERSNTPLVWSPGLVAQP